ncbi:unnamed protein product [Peniophora sp. CBMAI 1063]|nr:unnamed protein product [Peniophora sp. CBMAI 1063]
MVAARRPIGMAFSGRGAKFTPRLVRVGVFLLTCFIVAHQGYDPNTPHPHGLIRFDHAFQRHLLSRLHQHPEGSASITLRYPIGRSFVFATCIAVTFLDSSIARVGAAHISVAITKRCVRSFIQQQARVQRSSSLATLHIVAGQADTFARKYIWPDI